MTTHATTPHPNAASTDASARWTAVRTLRESSNASRVGAAATAALIAIATSSSDVAWPVAITLVALLPAVLVDLMVRRLPNRLIAGAAALATGAVILSTFLGSDIDASGAALGAVAMSVPLLVVHLVSPASMGFGDVKLALVIGGALGLADPTSALVALAAAAFLAAAHGLATGQRTVAFGPALLAGAVVVLVADAIGVLPITDSSTALAVARTPS